MAKEQNLSLNPTKISGVCGRLMCCLKNEEEPYYKVGQLRFRPKRKKEKVDIADKELKALEALEKKEGKSKLNDN